MTAPRRCAKYPDCRAMYPCKLHSTKNWRNTEYYTPISKAEKNEVIRQAGGKCKKCGRSANPGQVDHIINVARGGKNEMSNYQLLCKRCHDIKSKREAKYGRENKGRKRRT